MEGINLSVSEASVFTLVKTCLKTKVKRIIRLIYIQTANGFSFPELLLSVVFASLTLN